MSGRSAILHVAARELCLLRRRRSVRGALIVLAIVTWLPPLLLPLRSGALGLATFDETLLLQLVLAAVILPLLALLAGADLLAGEIEDRTLLPVVTLPISRCAYFLGKLFGRSALLATAYLVASASAAGAIALAHGADGWDDYLIVMASGLLLSLTCGGVGTALGVSERGRLRAFASALAAWIILVFLLDAVLLAAVVAFAPAAPEQIGMHGHSELRREMPVHDPQGNHEASPASRAAAAPTSPAWLMMLDPVDLFRLSALTGAPKLRARFEALLPGGWDPSTWAPLVLGWLIWLTVPPAVGLLRFRRVVLR
jgi:ABC-type transport system involved in multi-copper enzyme maturation permease subunit